MTLIVCILLWRIFDLAILEQHFLREQGNERVLRLTTTPAFRGMIVDRNGYPLAVSTTVYSVWMNPQTFTPTKEAFTALQSLLEMKSKDLFSLYQQTKTLKREFVYLKRSLSPEIAQQIKALHLPGIYLEQSYRRYYPEGEVTAHVLGFTNIDDQGQEGLELAYDNWLAGEAGKKWVIKDRLGRTIADVHKVQEQKSGRDVVLSIDRRIQYLAYRELLTAMIQNKAQSGSVVVLDAKTGEILAMVNQPSFNPNQRPIRISNQMRNRAVTDTFEPGSTIKAFSIASALDSKHFQPDTLIDTYPGWIRVGRNVVKDLRNYGELSVTQVLQKSSNVGVTKMILDLPPNQLWSLLHRVGFGENTGINFPGEQTGSLVKHEPWGSFILATLAFGYGISVTPLQLARAYAVIANEGMKMPVSLLRIDKPQTAERVMDAEAAKQMLVLLETVVTKEGTAKLADVPGYRVAGKTGTSLIAGVGGYRKQKIRYSASFVGITPASQPRLVIAVVIHDPQGKHYHGGTVAGPVFERIAEGTLRILNIPADAVNEA